MNAPMLSKHVIELEKALIGIFEQHALIPTDHVEYAQDPYSVPAKDLAPIDADILRETSAETRINGADIIQAMSDVAQAKKEVGLSEWQGWLNKYGWPEGHAGVVGQQRTRVMVYNTPDGYGVHVFGKLCSWYFIHTFVKG